MEVEDETFDGSSDVGGRANIYAHHFHSTGADRAMRWRLLWWLFCIHSMPSWTFGDHWCDDHCRPPWLIDLHDQQTPSVNRTAGTRRHNCPEYRKGPAPPRQASRSDLLCNRGAPVHTREGGPPDAVKGADRSQIAKQRALSVKTVSTYRVRVLRKL